MEKGLQEGAGRTEIQSGHLKRDNWRSLYLPSGNKMVDKEIEIPELKCIKNSISPGKLN